MVMGDYSKGFEDGKKDTFERYVNPLAKTCDQLENDKNYNAALVDELRGLLKAAMEIIQAYGEDVGYEPSRVREAFQFLRNEGWLRVDEL